MAGDLHRWIGGLYRPEWGFAGFGLQSDEFWKACLTPQNASSGSMTHLWCVMVKTWKLDLTAETILDILVNIEMRIHIGNTCLCLYGIEMNK